MPKITLIGAGSTVFAVNMLRDILGFPELAESVICLHDIDADRLRTTEITANRIAEKLGAKPRIECYLDRKAALEGANYAINMIQVGGYMPATVTDFEVPKKYELRQTIADTLGIGGIMRALRTIPVLLDMVNDMRRVCPDVLHLNYVNPMAMNCWALARSEKENPQPVKTIGLCHSVFGTAQQLAEDIGVPIEEVNYLAAGINHMAFYLKFEHNGVDLYPRIRQVIDEGRVPDWNRVRYQMLKHLGYFVTESSEHFSEYVPWFIKRDRPDLVGQYNIPLDEYIRRCEEQIGMWYFIQKYVDNPALNVDELLLSLQKAAEELGMPELGAIVGELIYDLTERRHSGEYGSLIIHSLETGQARVVYGNVTNDSLIDNLPQGCIVEVPCMVDKNGVQPTRVGALPPQLAALIQTNINVQALTVEAALTRKREHIYHAAMLDPHTAAELDVEQIHNLVDDMIAAHKGWLPEYA